MLSFEALKHSLVSLFGRFHGIFFSKAFALWNDADQDNINICSSRLRYSGGQRLQAVAFCAIGTDGTADTHECLFCYSPADSA